jgi:hypothetical protein
MSQIDALVTAPDPLVCIATTSLPEAAPLIA